jgi:hypothetical protein
MFPSFVQYMCSSTDGAVLLKVVWFIAMGAKEKNNLNSAGWLTQDQ